MKPLALALSVLLATGVAQADYTIVDKKVGRVCDRSVVAQARQFSVERTEQVAREFYATHVGTCSLVRLGYGEDPYAATGFPTIGLVGLDPTSFWRELYLEERPTTPVARLLALDGGAILATSLAGGVDERLLAGRSDPTWLKFGVSRFRLLHFVAEGQVKYTQTEARFYLRTPDDLNEQAAASLTSHLLELAGTDSVRVFVKNDSYFQLSADYPHVYRFEKNDLSYPWGPTSFWQRLLPSFLLGPGPSVLSKGLVVACQGRRTGGVTCTTVPTKSLLVWR